MKTPIYALLLPLLLAACQNGAGGDNPPVPQPIDNGKCGQRICTMQYDPVCATIETNGRRHKQTFGNNCAVCVDHGHIVRTRQGACEDRR